MNLSTRHVIARAGKMTKADITSIVAEGNRWTEGDDTAANRAFNEVLAMPSSATEEAFEAANAAYEAALKSAGGVAAGVAYSAALATAMRGKISDKSYEALTKLWLQAVAPIQ